MAITVAGVDVWKDKWIVVVLSDGQFDRAFAASTLETVLSDVPEAKALGVDIPIGLPEVGDRRIADQRAREYVGARRSSVFYAPCRDLLERPLAEANQLARERGWHGVSAQAHSLGRMIFQALPVADRDPRIFEVHPEVSFVCANGGEKLMWPKSSWNGVVQRRRILESQGIRLDDDLGPGGKAGVADVMDAAIAAWSAVRIAEGRAESFPPRSARIGAIWR